MVYNHSRHRRRVTALTVAAALGMILLVATWLPGHTSHANSMASADMGLSESAPASVPVTTNETTKIYLPMIMQGYTPPLPPLGTHMIRVNEAHRVDLAVQAGLHWVTFNSFKWDAIEPEPDAPYRWWTVDEESLANAEANGLQVIGVIKYAPLWAQMYEGVYCGPISPEALPAYADFLTDLVTRYSAPPYRVRYWQLGNEPDVDPDLAPDPHAAFGCWGDADDPYYGGGYYAEMLKVAYPAIKAADPNAKVVLGGLLLYCDPTAEPPGGQMHGMTDYLGGGLLQDCSPALFLEGILRNGGGQYLDFVNFHGYPQYDGTLQQDRLFLNWDDRGGVVLGKVDFLREVMATYSVDKPIVHTEGSLLCPASYFPELCDPPGEAFLDAQADYAVWLFVRNWAAGLPGTIWYEWHGPGWNHGSLLDENQEPKPAYFAVDFLAEELHRSEYAGPVNAYPGLLGFEFRSASKTVWVLWPPDEQPRTITLPVNTQVVYDKYGGDITPGNGIITVGHPIYVELAP